MDTLELGTRRRLDVPHDLRNGGVSTAEGRQRSLLCRVCHDVMCALPLEHVEETMRPLPITRLAGVPAFIQGLTVIRGVPTPVVNAASLLTGEASQATRFVTLKAGARRVVLAVESVAGVIELSQESVDALPQLLQNAELDAISAIRLMDAELLLVLCTTRLVTAAVWATIQAGGTEP
jgi:purine-binding chemotaxis protein CheW